MNKTLSIDEFDALEQISRLTKNTKPSICINRNIKRLSGIKFARYRKDGHLELTEEGLATLFAKHCLDGLRAINDQENAELATDVRSFLLKKSYATQTENGLQITARGL